MEAVERLDVIVGRQTGTQGVTMMLLLLQEKLATESLILQVEGAVELLPMNMQFCYRRLKFVRSRKCVLSYS